jgi:integrase
MKDENQTDQKTKPRAKGTGSVFLPAGSRFYWVAYFSGGRRRFESSRSIRKGDAQKLLSQRLGKVAEGVAITPAVGRLSFDAAMKAVIDDYKLNGRRSVSAIEGKIKNHLLPVFAGRRMANISAADIAAFATKRTEQGAAAAEVNRELSIIKRAFSLAVEHGTLLSKPVIKLLKESNARQGFFERAEHERVRAALPSDLGDLVEFLYWSGWRVSEACGLLWSNVDERAGVLRIETSKSGDPRTLPYHALPALAELIAHRRAVTDAAQKKQGKIFNHVFARDGEPIRLFRRSWITACIKAGLGVEKKDEQGRIVDRVALRIPHDYRRSAARNLSRAGVPERVIMSVCGWKTRNVFDRYRIVSETDLSEGLAKLANTTAPELPAKVAAIAGQNKKPAQLLKNS